MDRLRSLFVFSVVSILWLSFVGVAIAQDSKPASRFRIEVSFSKELSSTPLDGHIMLGFAVNDKAEPRFQLKEEEAESAQFFGLDVDGLAPGASAAIDGTTLGYPMASLDQLKPGDYTVQAVLNIYETFRRKDGNIVKLPPDKGEGQQWNRKPGNFYSKPMKVHIDPASNGVFRVLMTEKIPAIEEPKDSKYVKHFRIESKLLSEFWGRPMYLGAIVVLPEGFDEHPRARYPLLLEHGHFAEDFDRFRMEPPAPEMKGGEQRRAQAAYKLFQDWTSGRLPRVLLLLIQHANPYYDDSYAVNSANIGPYGDAITQELIPEVERRYRGIGQGWARAVLGGSTGGWEALVSQVFYPDYFNGAYSFCPDPIDFHAYQAVNLYEDKNAFWSEGPFGRVPRPEMRDTEGRLSAIMEPAVRREEVMGTRGRSTEQFGAWQAVFSPMGQDGYPKAIWDPKTGVIDSAVANYWKEHFDLTHIMQRDWKRLGPKLVGKLHITAGDMDTWYLNNAVHRLQNFLESAENPYKVADVEYGWGKPHCYTGGGNGPMSESVQTVLQRTMPVLVKHMIESAPKDADMSWRY